MFYSHQESIIVLLENIVCGSSIKKDISGGTSGPPESEDGVVTLRGGRALTGSDVTRPGVSRSFNRIRL